MEITDDQRRFLQTTFDYFDKQGEWPTRRYLTLTLHTTLSEDISSIAKSLAPEYIYAINRWMEQGRVVLTIRGLAACHGAEGVIADLVRVIRLCVDKYFDPSEDQPKITSDELRERWGITDVSLRKVQDLLGRDPWAINGGGGSDQRWEYIISGEIRHYHGIQTAEEYLQKRQELEERSSQRPFAEQYAQEGTAVIQENPLTPEESEDRAYSFLWDGFWDNDMIRPRYGRLLADKELQEATNLVQDFVEQLAACFERRGESLQDTPPFAQFSYVAVLFDGSMVVIFGQAAGRFALHRDQRGGVRAPSAEELIALFQPQLGWKSMLGLSLPSSLLAQSSEERAKSLSSLAEAFSGTMLIPVAQQIPTEIRESLARFQKEHPHPQKLAFIMMKFGGTTAHQSITKAIKDALEGVGIVGLRADDKSYHDDLYFNVLTYIYGCQLGVAVFERIEANDFNPNVSLELGYMFGLQKPVCLLKDKTLTTLHTDLVGKLYKVFDPLDAEKTIPDELRRWLGDKGMLPRSQSSAD